MRPATIHGWQHALDKWILPNLGDKLVAETSNGALREAAGLNTPPRTKTLRLERKAQAKFHLTIGKWDRRGNVAKLIWPPTQIRVGIREVRRIGQIVRLRAELPLDLFGDGEVLEER